MTEPDNHIMIDLSDLTFDERYYKKNKKYENLENLAKRIKEK